MYGKKSPELITIGVNKSTNNPINIEILKKEVLCVFISIEHSKFDVFLVGLNIRLDCFMLK